MEVDDLDRAAGAPKPSLTRVDSWKGVVRAD